MSLRDRAPEFTITLCRDDVRAELRRIALSRTFGQSPRCCALLSHLVRQENNQKYLEVDIIPAMSGRARRPTAGIEPGVSLAGAIQLARLRNKLNDYYAGEGCGNALRIRVPDEGYQVSIDVAHDDASLRL